MPEPTISFHVARDGQNGTYEGFAAIDEALYAAYCISRDENVTVTLLQAEEGVVTLKFTPLCEIRQVPS